MRSVPWAMVDDWLSRAEAAARLGAPVREVCRRTDAGELGGYRLGVVIRQRAEDLPDRDDGLAGVPAGV